MIKKWIVLICLLFITLIATACSSPFQDRGMPEEVTITAGDLPQEPGKDELTSTIKGNTSNDIDSIIESNFPLMDVVTGEGNQSAEIYATNVFSLSELEAVLTSAITPEEISEVKDSQQILIYPNHFVTLKVSDDDQDVMLIEVAEDEFVQKNYSPSFLQTYFAFRILDSVLGVNNWGNRRASECRTGNCYGGYTGQGYGTPGRGNSSYRGGGPGSGK
ncbi:DUF4247 domain-containing protein [Virgibacillus byunsanensis]|uniref:DUF4247 domain-containing protein n=1 Tax=Virgibacillus byunsanensis TaxID=570945 RepID=A0ABW3LII7_9BACI